MKIKFIALSTLAIIFMIIAYLTSNMNISIVFACLSGVVMEVLEIKVDKWENKNGTKQTRPIIK